MIIESDFKNKVICIVGPTASGKTDISIELAKKISNVEIISADSMQIYKNLDIATAKITPEEMQQTPHHLINICDIDEKYSVAQYKRDCYMKIEEIFKRKNVPIIVGGTGLYVSAVVNNMSFPEQEINIEYRNSLYELAKLKSNKAVYEILEKLDPKAALNIHPNNLKRVIRAIEYAKFSQENKSEYIESEKERIEKKENIPYNFYVFGIKFDREKLYDRINYRVDKMIERGLIKEAKFVYDKKLPESSTCMQSIGYKEFFDYFENKKTLEECIEQLKKNTRRYAKRQITWFSHMDNITWLNAFDTKEKICNEILEKVYGKKKRR